MARLHTYDQHFLRSPRLVAELIGHSNVRKNDTVYDLGAGSGVISSVLAGRCKKVYAVEIEPTALKHLREHTKDAENVEILAKDLLQIAPREESYKIFANPPFSLSSQLVRRFTSLERTPKSMYLVAQKQFARKLEMSDRHFTSQLGVMIAPWYTVRIRKPLRKTDFTPPPAVDTVLVEIKRREQSLLPANQRVAFGEFVEQCFTNSRALKQLMAQTPRQPERQKPSELTLEYWLELYWLGC